MILPPFFLLFSAGLALLAPFLAGHLVLTSLTSESRAHLRGWFGVTVSIELLTAVPVAAMAAGLYGPEHWPPYRLALVIAILSMMLGIFMMRLHARRLHGGLAGGKALPFACLGFAATVGLFLLPWIFAAPMPFPIDSEGPQATAGNVRAYAAFVLPAFLVLGGEAWLLATTADQNAGHRRWLLAATGGLAAMLILSLAALPTWSRNPGRAAMLERDRLLRHATDLDLPRRAVLADLVGRREPALTVEPCPSVPETWRSRAGFGTPPKDRASLARAANAWKGLESVNVWLPGATDRARPHGQVPGQAHDQAFEGPLRRRVAAALDEGAFPSPWTRRDTWLSADEARRRVEGRTHTAPWHADGTLIVTRETPSFASYGESNLGMVEASLWLWSYDQRALLCGGRARVPPYTIADTFGDAQATMVRDALRMRALALAIADLRAVAPPP